MLRTEEPDGHPDRWLLRTILRCTRITAWNWLIALSRSSLLFVCTPYACPASTNLYPGASDSRFVVSNHLFVYPITGYRVSLRIYHRVRESCDRWVTGPTLWIWCGDSLISPHQCTISRNLCNQELMKQNTAVNQLIVKKTIRHVVRAALHGF